MPSSKKTAAEISSDVAVITERLSTIEEDIVGVKSSIEIFKTAFGDKVSCEKIRDNSVDGASAYNIIKWIFRSAAGAVILVFVTWLLAR